MDFSLIKDDESPAPYAYLLDGVELAELSRDTVERFVMDAAARGIYETNYSEPDQAVFDRWLQSGELSQAAYYITQRMAAAGVLEYGSEIHVELTLPNVEQPGEWRLSVQDFGPLGGERWQVIATGQATGGKRKVMLMVGQVYKETYWKNNWPYSRQFVAGVDVIE